LQFPAKKISVLVTELVAMDEMQKVKCSVEDASVNVECL